jgi:hypothetical protein
MYKSIISILCLTGLSAIAPTASALDTPEPPCPEETMAACEALLNDGFPSDAPLINDTFPVPTCPAETMDACIALITGGWTADTVPPSPMEINTVSSTEWSFDVTYVCITRSDDPEQAEGMFIASITPGDVDVSMWGISIDVGTDDPLQRHVDGTTVIWLYDGQAYPVGEYEVQAGIGPKGGPNYGTVSVEDDCGAQLADMSNTAYSDTSYTTTTVPDITWRLAFPAAFTDTNAAAVPSDMPRQATVAGSSWNGTNLLVLVALIFGSALFGGVTGGLCARFCWRQPIPVSTTDRRP